MKSTKKHIENLVRGLQDTWLNNDVDGLGQFYDDNVVLLPPGDGDLIVGKKAVIESYILFLRSSKVHLFEINDLHVEVLETIATAILSFDVTYEMNNKTYQESGADIMIFLRKERGNWLIVWRTQIPKEQSAT